MADKDIVNEFAEYLIGMKGTDPIMLSGGLVAGCIAITTEIEDGYWLAYESGWEHRVSKQHWAWRMVHSKTLQVISVGHRWSEEQSFSMPASEAKKDVRPWYLGCSPEPLFKLPAVVYPARSLFVYPENWLVPRQEREFVSRLENRQEVRDGTLEVAVIITKSPVILSDFFESHIRTYIFGRG